MNLRKSLLVSADADDENNDAKSDHLNAEEAAEGPEDLLNKKEDWENNEITKLEDVIELFPGFNIPYYYSHSYEVLDFLEHIDEQYMIKEVPVVVEQQGETVELFRNEVEKQRQADVFDSEQKEKIKKIHENMHLEVNS